MGGVAGGYQAHFQRERVARELAARTESITAECGCMTEPDGYGNEVVAEHASTCELFMDDPPEGER